MADGRGGPINGAPDRPGVVSDARRDACVADASRRKAYRPGRSVPVFDKRCFLGLEVGPDRPDVVLRSSVDTRERGMGPAGRVRTGHDSPRAPIPMLNQSVCLIGFAIGHLPTDGPYIVWRRAADRRKARLPTQCRRRNHAPDFTVPVLHVDTSRFGTALTNRPHVVGGKSRHAVQSGVRKIWRIGEDRPALTVPMLY